MKVSACVFATALAGFACVARGESDALRAYISAQLSASSPANFAVCFGASCPSSAYTRTNGICFLGSFTINGYCYSNSGYGTTIPQGSGTVTCGGQIFTCSSIPSCTSGPCPTQAYMSAAESYCSSVSGNFKGKTDSNGCGTYQCGDECIPYNQCKGGCTRGLIVPPHETCPAFGPGNVNVPTIFLAVLGTLAAAML
jgi:hypothetical protein